MEFCIIYPRWYNYNIVTTFFHKTLSKLHLGIIGFLLVEI